MKKTVSAILTAGFVIGCIGAVNAETWYYKSTGSWTGASENPFPDPVLSDNIAEWGNFENEELPKSAAVINPENYDGAGNAAGEWTGELETCIDPITGGYVAAIFVHENNPIEAWWEPGDSSAGMAAEAAELDLDFEIELWLEDPTMTGAPDISLSAGGDEPLLFYETHNDGDPTSQGDPDIFEDYPGLSEGDPSYVDDLFIAPNTYVSSDSIAVQDAGIYQATLSGFYTLNDDDSVSGPTARFWSAEGGNSVAALGIEVHTVPEPTTWAMILFGIAGIGFARLRRR